MQNHFDNYWEDDSMNSPSSYYLEDGHLKIMTRPQTKDRVKVKSKRSDFGQGTYEWRIFVPNFNLNDQCNIGAFLYHSGEMEYELDFEVGSGTRKHRNDLSANPNEVIVYCTSQNKPHHSERFLIESEKWHLFKMTLEKGRRGHYLVKWYINDILVKTLQTKIKTKITFSVHNSLENLSFVGEQLPIRKNEVLFDSFDFE
ncbi:MULTISPECIES: hypothetical protein [unclassified Lentimicrobium]|uniref:hypothetical protein n=1 Tax=unclassified Lentimicrobium TaxID=2677434 RepID=UPI001552E5F2|nr:MULTISPECIES: hypothetical protein [unclassified Lentimicrobium]NPD45435.1 hypothetical protein [Lentimicrobium sp. S6]NPD83797.1 hypothetical protein [Lentimicrobium sp. L6]